MSTPEDAAHVEEIAPKSGGEPPTSPSSASSSSNPMSPLREHMRSRSMEHVVDWTPFVARHVRTFYQRRDGAPLGEAKMIAKKFSVVAMADISGYSKLTTALAAKGDEAAENLTKIINPYLQFMVDIVEKSGGDVIKFIGDAILMSWDQQGSEEDTVASASLACVRLIERLGTHYVEIPGEDVKYLLSMHIGLSVGEVFDVHVGTEQRMEYFICGKAVKEAVVLVNVAQKREIAISAGALHHLQVFEQNVGIELGIEGRVGGIILTKLELPSDAKGTGVTYNFSSRSAPEPPPQKKIYQNYINESIVHRLLGNPVTEFEKMGFVNELRRVTVLFLKIEGLNVHAEESLPTMQSTMTIVQQVLKNFDGTLRQMVIDDKGATILSVFGLPPLSHENNSIFGIRAALQLQSLLKDLVSFSIGLTSGSVFTGIIGSRKRCDHTILGEPVNLSARMMCSPLVENGGILCDVATQKATKDEIEFTMNDAQNFFKDQGPIDCYTVIGQKKSVGKSLFLAPFPMQAIGVNFALIGREKEMKMIETTFFQFVELNKLDKEIDETDDGKGKSAHFRRKSAVPRIKAADTKIPTIGSFDNFEIPRIVLEGDGGFGKSTLLSYARDLALNEGFAVAFVKADEVDKSTPYFVYRDILSDLFDFTILSFEREVGSNNSPAPDRPRNLKGGRLNSSPNLTRGLGGSETIGKSQSIHGTNLGGTMGVKGGLSALSSFHNEDVRTDFLSKICFAMDTLGLDASTVHLLSPIFPALGTASRSDHDRKDLVTDLVARIIERFTATISPLVMMIDDVHWMDSLSYRLTWTIVRKCSGVFMVLGSRTQSGAAPKEQPSTGIPTSVSTLSLSNEDDDANALQGPALRNSAIINESIQSNVGIHTKIKLLPSTLNISLVGIPRDAVEKLVTIYCGFAVRSVQEKLLNEIVRKTGGNPLFVERLAANMKGKVCFEVTPSGELMLKGGQTLGSSPLDEFEWGDDPESAMLVQFDRLPPEMQLILRTASVFGQSFSLDVVAQVLGYNLTPKQCFDTISAFPDVRAFVGWEEPDVRDKYPQYRVFFKSAVLQKCIYSAMLSDQKQEIHHAIASKYEGNLTESNMGQLLPLIAYHYAQTKDVLKRIQSLDRASTHCVQAGSYSEAITSLTKLFEMAQQEEKKFDPVTLKEDYSRWHMLLGTAYVGRSEWSRGQTHLYKALENLDFEFPTTVFTMKVALWNNYLELKKHWKNRTESKPKQIDVKEINKIKQVCDVLNALNTCFTFIGDGKSAEFCLLTQLNFCERIGMENAKIHKFHFGQIEAATAMILWMRNKHSLALEYFARAKTISEYTESISDQQSYYALRATMLLSSGKIKESLDSMQSVLSLHKRSTRGIAESHIIHIDMALISLLDGEFYQHRADVASVYESAVDNNDDGTLAEAACMMIQSLLLAPPHFPDGITDVTNWISVAENMFESWTDAKSSNVHLLNISSALFLYYAFKDAKRAQVYNNQFLSALGASSSRLKSPLGYLIAPYIFFFLIAQHRLYMIHVENHEDAGGWKVNEAIKAIEVAMHSLRVLEKWWSFSTPLLYLAEGLALLFKGSAKKAVRVWIKGIKKTEEVSENLKFMRATLQTRVVRYSPGGKDAMRMEVAEYLAKVNARTELSLLAEDFFSPLPDLDDEETMSLSQELR